MFRPNIDYTPWHNRLRASGRVQVPNILEDHYAEQLHAVLAAENEWSLAYQAATDKPERIEHADYVALSADQRAQLVARVANEARGRFAYVYESYSMSDRYDDPKRADHVLRQLVDVLHHEPILDFVRRLTGDPGIASVRVQATRYLPGHFLRRHDDTGYTGQQRRYAFVFNLGRGWQADWGGLLQFLDPDGRVVDTFVPTYNSLSLFKVPQLHCVSPVAAWAEEPRYGLTGWFLS
jgi:Rps23 Pro-64 3,4-dihydroxylase Tpa1-like proline 4-hydroxylase